jgi:hypothetical protein
MKTQTIKNIKGKSIKNITTSTTMFNNRVRAANKFKTSPNIGANESNKKKLPVMEKSIVSKMSMSVNQSVAVSKATMHK